jgi:hypothetical protein
LTADVVRVADAAEVTSRVVVGRAGNADVDGLRRCVLVAVAVVVRFVEVDAPRTVDVDVVALPI